jgi:hypothetical protein
MAAFWNGWLTARGAEPIGFGVTPVLTGPIIPASRIDAVVIGPMKTAALQLVAMNNIDKHRIMKLT